MKWLEIVRFELVYQLTRKSTWIFFAVFMFPMFGETNGQVLEALEREILFHAPLFIAQSSVGMGMILLLVMAAIVGDAATRDVQLRVESLMHTEPMSRAVYLGGRFVGAFIVCAVLLLVVPLALMLAPFVHSSLTPELVGPFRPAVFLQSYFLLVLPNALVATAVMFTGATMVRHTMGSYLGAVTVLAGTLFTTGFVGGTLGRWDLAALLNPLGHTSLSVMSRTWSPGDVNTRLVGLDGGLLGNRLLMLGLVLALLSFAYTQFRYGGSALSSRWWQRRRAARARAEELAPPARVRSEPVPRASRDFGVAGRVRQTLAITRDSLREVATGWIWLLLPFMALQIVVNIQELEIRGTPTLPTTGRVLESFDDLFNTVLIFVTLLAGELVWRERDANAQSLADAAPVPNRVLFVGKLLGLWLIVVALHGLIMLAGVLIQVLLGWSDFEPGLYLRILFGLQLVGPLAFALLVLSVHVVVNQKHVGHLLVLALVLSWGPVAQLFGIEHPLLFPFAAPGWRYSPISGFDPFVTPFVWFKLYWALWALLLAIVAGLFWERGIEPGMRERVRLARRRFTGRTAASLAAIGGLVLLVGGFVFYNTNVLNEYESSAAGPERQAEYERRYGGHAGAPQPEIVATELDVEIFPDRRAASIRGVYHLSNRTSRPIDTVHVAVSLQVETRELEFDRAARAALIDEEHGHRIYVLDEALQPGDSLTLSWEVRHEPRGFPARGISTAVVENGTFIQTWQWIPLIGYQKGRELSSPVERREHGLALRPTVPSLDDAEANRKPHSEVRTYLKATVGTAPDQIAVAPGELRRTWTRDGRRYFEYATDAPIGQGYAIFSADYAVRTARWNDITIELVHHPAHDVNVERMMRGLRASLEQYTERFGPYPYSVLRLIEWPGEGAGGAHAASGSIWFEAVFSLFDPDRDERRIDLPFAVIAHEVAHQFQPVPALVEGIALLSESFAWYAAMGVIEQEYGTEHLERFLGFMRRDNLTPRSRADVPLLRASDWFLAYRKGPFAMYALREYVGQDSVDLAWRRLIAAHASHAPPFATSLDLYRELRQVTPDSLQYLLADLLERNTFWELETQRATARPTASGEWQVTLEVHARKVAVDTAGTETVVPMNDLIEIGVYAAAATGESSGSPLYLAMHRLHAGPQTITITVRERPARAGVDPRHLLIDVETHDNVVDITDASAPRGAGT